MEQKTAEEIWDENSSTIGDTISDMDFWCGRVVMERKEFLKAAKEYAALAVKWPTPQEYLGALYTECTEAMTPLAQAEAMIKWLRNR